MPCSLRAAAAALLLATSAPLAAQAPLVLPLGRLNGVRTLDVRVGGDTARYLFDTGGGATVISPQDSARLGCVPGGAGFGVRLTGQVLAGRQCAAVPLAVGPLDATDDAGVMDLPKLMGPNAPPVRGMISLRSFRDRAITLDLAHDRLIVETPASLAARVRGLTPLEVRLATGEGGGTLVAFIGVRATNGARLWLEWDSENHASTLLSPHALALLGADSSQAAADVRVALAPGLAVTIPALRKRDMIHDGVLSAGFLARATWTLDLATGRMWVGPVAPVLERPAAAAARVVPPAEDPVGLYETTVVVGGRPQPGVMEIAREGGRLVARGRGIGDDDGPAHADVAFAGGVLTYRILLPNGAVPVRLTFDGVRGTGTWGDGGVRRGGAATATKIR